MAKIGCHLGEMKVGRVKVWHCGKGAHTSPMMCRTLHTTGCSNAVFCGVGAAASVRVVVPRTALTKAMVVRAVPGECGGGGEGLERDAHCEGSLTPTQGRDFSKVDG